MPRNQERQGDLLIGIAALLWSVFPIVTVLSYSNLPPLVSLGWSTLFAAAFFAVMLTVRRRWHELKDMQGLRYSLLTGLFIGVLYYAFLFWGLKLTSAGNASIIALMEVFFSFLLFNVWRREYISGRHVFGAVLMLAGAGIVLYPNFSHFQTGDILVLIGTAFAPFGNLYQQKARRIVASETIMFVRSLVAGIFILGLAYLVRDSFALAGFRSSLWFLLINGFILLGFSKVLWIEGIHRISVTRALILSDVGPLFTLFFAWLILNQRPTVWQVAAFIPMFLAVILLNSKDKPSSSWSP